MKKNNTKKALASLAIAGMALTAIPLNVLADTGVTTARLFGTDRIGTAISVADAGFASATTAILAPSADGNLVDALAAAPLAGKTAPILLTDNNTLTDATKAELIKLGVKDIYVVGAINQSVVDQVNAIPGMTATVLKGSDRIGTAAAISAKLTQPAGSFVVGYGALADALSVASYAAANNYSILVANPDGSLPASEAAYKGDKVYIVGGPTLVQDIPGATRLFGQDRFATNQAVLKALNYSYNNVYVANGSDAHLVDSLVASSLAAESGAPIVLGDTSEAAAANDVHAKLASNAVVTALGGTSVVPDAVVASVVNGGQVTPPPVNSSISNVAVAGQTVGDGTSAKPAIAAVNGGMTVSATVIGAQNGMVTFLVSNSTNITATANGQTLVATNLSSPTIIGNDKYSATYSAMADANGNVSVKFTSAASSNNSFNVVVQAPFYNGTTPVRSDSMHLQWGIPGTMVLSPIYSTSTSPYQVNYSQGGTARGLIPVVATLLPSTAGDTVSGKDVKFSLTTTGGSSDSASTVMITDSTGANMVDAGSYAGISSGGSAGATVTYTTQTDANGQAIMYLNSNMPSKNGYAVAGAKIDANIQAQLVNGGSSTNTTYLEWDAFGYPAQLSNISPSQSLNDATSASAPGANTDNVQTAVSGSTVTFSGTLQDAAGNPVPNAKLVVQDYDVIGGASSQNLSSDSFISADGKTSTLFSSSSYPTLTTDVNGNYSFTTSATIPATQSTANSVTKYFIYYVSPTTALPTGTSLGASDVTSLGIAGGSGFLSVLWQQGNTVQAVGINHDALMSQYSTLADVPQTQTNSRLVQSARGLYVAAYNQNGELIAPATGTQFEGYTLKGTITAPLGQYISKFDGYTFSTAGTAGTLGSGVVNVSQKYITKIQYTISDGGKIAITDLEGNNDGRSDLNSAVTSAADYTANLSSTQLAAVSGGMATFSIQSCDDMTNNGVSGTTNVSIAAFNSAGDAEGAASGTANISFVPASSVASVGLAASVQSMSTYSPLLQANTPLPATLGLSGAGYGGASESTGAYNGGNATFVAGAFNSYPNISTIPTQGITYNVSADKNGELFSIDGYAIPGSPSNASVTIRQDGSVSVNNVGVLDAGTVGYAVVNQSSSADVYQLTATDNGTNTTYKLTDKTTGKTWSTAAVADSSLYQNPNVPYIFDLNGTTGQMTIKWGNISSGSTTVTLTADTGNTDALPSMALTPVQLISVNAADEYSETTNVTVANTLNSQTATAQIAFEIASSNVGNIVSNPSNISASINSSKNVTFVATDVNGNPVANHTFYLKTDNTGNSNEGLWVTQVNGQTIQSNANLYGSTSGTLVNTPVPLFDTTGLAAANDTTLPDNMGLTSISFNGLTAYKLNGIPVVSLQTGVDGTVSITLADGNITYVGNNGTQNEYAVSAGKAVTSNLYLYDSNPTGVNVTTQAPLGTVSVSIH